MTSMKGNRKPSPHPLHQTSRRPIILSSFRGASVAPDTDVEPRGRLEYEVVLHRILFRSHYDPSFLLSSLGRPRPALAYRRDGVTQPLITHAPPDNEGMGPPFDKPYGHVGRRSAGWRASGNDLAVVPLSASETPDRRRTSRVVKQQRIRPLLCRFPAPRLRPAPRSS